METPNSLKKSPKRPNIEELHIDPVQKRKRRTDSKCPICLNSYENASMIRVCGHIFCFDCIKKWISQKPNCPLCKQRVDFIKHKFKTSAEPTWDDSGKTVTARDIIESEELKRLSEHTWPLDSELELIENAFKRVDSMLSTKINPNIIRQTFELRNKLLELRREAEKKRRIDVICDPLFRFVIYYMEADRHSLITTHTDITLNAQYVRENRVHLRSELVPFVVREIHAITGLEAIDIERLMDVLLNSLENPEKNRDKLFTYLKSIGVDHPRTFYKHVQEFGTADQSIKLYDENSRYKLRINYGPAFIDDNAEVQVILPPDSDDIQFVGVSRINPPLITLS